jgi:hypothetical protein
MARQTKARTRGARIPSGVVTTVGGVPEIYGDALRWTYDYRRVKWRLPDAGLLGRFALLWKKTPEDIVAFAREWGPLRVDEHCLPTESTTESEPLAAWDFLSRRAYAVMQLAAALRTRRRGDSKYWKFIADNPFSRSVSIVRLLEDAGMLSAAGSRRETLALEVSSWLARFNVGLRIEWARSRSSWELQISYGGSLIAALALRLALAVANVESLFACSGCGSPYIRGVRSPNEGQANYCQDCFSGRVPERAAEARSRQKRRAQRDGL